MASLSNDAVALIHPACPHAFVRFTGFDAEKVPNPLPNTDDLEPKMGALPVFSLLSLANNGNGVFGSPDPKPDDLLAPKPLEDPLEPNKGGLVDGLLVSANVANELFDTNDVPPNAKFVDEPNV